MTSEDRYAESSAPTIYKTHKASAVKRCQDAAQASSRMLDRALVWNALKKYNPTFRAWMHPLKNDDVTVVGVVEGTCPGQKQV